MLEIEIKAKIDSIAEVEKKLLDRGGVFQIETIEEDIYFNHPCRDFACTDEALRIRYADDIVSLTYKGSKLDNLTKTREEFYVNIDSLENGFNILKSLGFSQVLTVKKKRRYYRLGNYRVMLDYLKELGSFIEVEKSGEYNPKELMDFLGDLGIKGSITKSYLEMLLEKHVER